MERISIDNIIPIRHFEFSLRPGGGVTVLRGPNESGKSNTLEAVNALLGAEHDLQPDPRVLAESSVSGFGVRLRLSARSKRPQGELEVETLEGVDPSKFVDPGIDDPARADAARLVTLCRMVGAVPDIQAFNKALGFDVEEVMGEKTRALLSSTLPEFTASLRRDLQRRAQESEEIGKAHAARAAGLREQAGPENEKAGGKPAEHWSRLAGWAAGEKAELTRTALERELREREAKLATARLADLRSEQGSDLDELRAEANRLGEQAAANDRRISELKSALAEAQKLAETLRSESSAVVARYRRAEERQKALESLQATVDAVGVGETAAAIRERLEGLEISAREIDASYRAALFNDRRAEQLKVAEQEAALARDAEGSAQKDRNAARECERVLSDAIAKLSPRGLVAREGRILVQRPDGEVHYHVLSQGAKYTLAIQIACDGLKAAKKPPVLVISQEGWESLDPVNKRKVDEIARDPQFQVNILTAAADDGQLRAEPFEPSVKAPAMP